MNVIDYTEENIKILDTIDFSPFFKYIKKGQSVWNFLNAVEDKFDGTQLVNNDICEGCIFNWLSEDEIVEYFEKRYPNKFKTTTYIENRFC